MRCPRCRSEVGSQPVCPYCGGTIYLQTAYPSNTGYAPMTQTQESSHDPTRRGKHVERKLRGLEMKVDLLVVLTGGNILLLLILLIAILLK